MHLVSKKGDVKEMTWSLLQSEVLTELGMKAFKQHRNCIDLQGKLEDYTSKFDIHIIQK